ncbi:phosphoribosyl-ATP diphosphatase [Candidatus Peregrinibacteria bacterium]|nr:phosphoribosyl-ATP diphosphatase [Candidatus Peregrinibacteria bacterium]
MLELFELIKERKAKRPKNSYTSTLFNEGLAKICEKVLEEAEEVTRAAKSETKKRLIEESCDLLYHTLVLLAQKGVGLEAIEGELRRRPRGPFFPTC